MFTLPIKPLDHQLLVRIISADAVLVQRVRKALEGTKRFHVESDSKPLAGMVTALQRGFAPPLLIVDLDHQSDSDFAALDGLLKAWNPAPAVIVVSDGVNESAARRLLKLQVTDWLPRTSQDREIVLACEHVLHPQSAHAAATQAQCLTFIPAIGGAGSTTLCLAALAVLRDKARVPLSKCCIVDLDFQAASMPDYLDVAANLQLGEIVAAPERLDGHLLEVMLTRHASGFAVLAAPPSLLGFSAIAPEIVGRLLDLASSKFDYVLIDMPRVWFPWCESVVRGTDRLFIVTELTVAGLRQGRRLADVLAETCEIDPRGTVIVNKAPWLAGHGVKKSVARDVLDDRLAGYVVDAAQVVRDAQNRGLLLSDVKRSNRVESDLATILLGGGTAKKTAAKTK